jgi:hypothetical protein
MLSICSYANHSYVVFGEMSSYVLCPFFNQMLGFDKLIIWSNFAMKLPANQEGIGSYSSEHRS